MSDTKVGHGAALAAWLDDLLGTESMREFGRRTGYDHARPSAWKAQEDVNATHMLELARALDMPMSAVLLAAGYGTADDFGGVLPPPPALALREAIQRATDVGDEYKARVLQMLDWLDSGLPVEAEPAETHGRKRRTRA